MSGIIFAIGETFRSFTRRWFLSVLTIISVSVGLFIFGVFLFLTLNFQVWFERLGQRIDLEVYLSRELPPDSLKLLENWIASLGDIKSIEYISKDEAKARFASLFGEEVFEGLDFNPLPPSIRILFKSGVLEPEKLEPFVKKLLATPFVKDVAIETKIARKLHRLLKLFWICVVVGGIVLFAGIFLIIVNTIKLAIFSRRESIEVMSLIGATKPFIRRPFIFEGILQGLIAGAVSSLLVHLLALGTNRLIPDIVQEFRLLSIGIVLLGGVLGGIGAGFAIKKFLNA